MKVHLLDTTADVEASVAWARDASAALREAGAGVRIVARSGRLRSLLTAAAAGGRDDDVEVTSDGGTSPAPAERLLAVTAGVATSGDAILVRGLAGVRELVARTPAAQRWIAPDAELLADDDATWETIAEATELIVCRDEVERAQVVARWPAASWRTQVLGSPALARRCQVAAPRGRPPLRGRKIAVTGHDLKFFDALIPVLERAGAQVRVDPWRSHVRHDERRSKRHLDWADTVVCEWALGNAVWYSRHRRANQRLVVRLHLQELVTPFPDRIHQHAVDATVFVSGFTRDRAAAQLGWSERLHVLPNAIDVDAFDRPKLDGSQFVLGLLGFLPQRKRLDRAIDLVERLRAVDDRFHLEVAGAMPWDSEWVSQRSDEQDYYHRQFDRVERSPRLRHAVRFVGPVADVPGWFRRVGWVLSPSDFESFHLAPAEGMAARSLPVLWEREGVHEIFPSEHVVADTDAALAKILAGARDPVQRTLQGESARAFVAARYDLPTVAAQWVDLLATLPKRPTAVSAIPDGVRDLANRLPAPAKVLAKQAARKLGVA
ncbi:MAG TPA: glycosyltransferase family 4 protein [Egicoccus sp.]|nr:glycosyltransferase family 4 protein [Egicoccus sp.]HSK22599.1 glycosyltransferase family 4 protein [Egicoccus sp.]